MNLFAVLVALSMYPTTFIVTEVETETGLCICEDFNGNVWEVYTDDGDWFVGDIMAVVMYTNETETIYDDEVVCARYAGYIEGYMETYLFPEDLQAIE